MLIKLELIPLSAWFSSHQLYNLLYVQGAKYRRRASVWKNDLRAVDFKQHDVRPRQWISTGNFSTATTPGRRNRPRAPFQVPRATPRQRILALNPAKGISCQTGAHKVWLRLVAI